MSLASGEKMTNMMTNMRLSLMMMRMMRMMRMMMMMMMMMMIWSKVKILFLIIPEGFIPIGNNLLVKRYCVKRH